jgi:hypothetical protein
VLDFSKRSLRAAVSIVHACSQAVFSSNGLALCPWIFDKGTLAVSADYRVNASPRLRADINLPAHLAALDCRGMIRPPGNDYWPAADDPQKVHFLLLIKTYVL